MTTQDRSALADVKQAVTIADSSYEQRTSHDEHLQDVEKTANLAVEVSASRGAGADTEKVASQMSKNETHAEEDRNLDLVEWDGEDDPENPYNWSKTRKWINGGLVSAMTFVT